MEDKIRVTLRCGHTITYLDENAYAINYHNSGEFWGDLCEECFCSENTRLKLVDEGSSEWSFEDKEAQEMFEKPYTDKELDIIIDGLELRWNKLYKARENSKDEENKKHLTELMDECLKLKNKVFKFKQN